MHLLASPPFRRVSMLVSVNLISAMAPDRKKHEPEYKGNKKRRMPGSASPAPFPVIDGGPYQVRTDDLLNAIEALYQLS